MPLSFPSHQGLIAPLWRRWPDAFDVPALFIGAATPDVVDGVVAVWHGHMGQGIGHSLVGLVFLCVPAGLLIWLGFHAAARRLRPLRSSGFWARVWNPGLDAMSRGVSPGRFIGESWRVVGGMTLGGFSHLLIDLVSHGGFPWLMPWVPKIAIYPSWWYVAWIRVPLPGYMAPCELAVHNIIWIGLSALGIYLLFRPAFQKSRP
jgi:membrane-bound metal-dependent hydrolase YbcI (DUF457 family)